MTKARNIADLLDGNGDVVSGALDNVPASNDASALTTGTIDNARISLVEAEIPSLNASKIGAGTFPDARLPATALNSNVDLTNLSASHLTSGTVATARLGSGTASSSTFLRGDGSFAVPAGGVNTPYWYAYGHASGQGSSSGTFTKMEATKIFDSDGSAYDNSNFRWTCPSGQGGKYWVSIATQPYNTSVQGTGSQVVPYHNGNSKGNAYNASHHAISLFRNHWIMWSGIIDVSAGDYLEAYYFTVFNSGSGGAAYGKFSGYKLIE